MGAAFASFLYNNDVKMKRIFLVAHNWMVALTTTYFYAALNAIGFNLVKLITSSVKTSVASKVRLKKKYTKHTRLVILL
jgi:hypothetical protein